MPSSRRPLIRHTEKVEAILLAKSKFTPVFAAIEFPLGLAEAQQTYRISWLLRQLSAKVEGAEAIVFEAKEILFSGNAPFADLIREDCPRFGRSAVALYGPDPKRTRLLLAKFAEAEAETEAEAVAEASGAERDSANALLLEVLETPPAPLHVHVEIVLSGNLAEDLRDSFEEFASTQNLPYTTRREGGWMGLSWCPILRKAGEFWLAQGLSKARIPPPLLLEVGEKARLLPLIEGVRERCGAKPPLRILGWD